MKGKLYTVGIFLQSLRNEPRVPPNPRLQCLLHRKSFFDVFHYWLKHWFWCSRILEVRCVSPAEFLFEKNSKLFEWISPMTSLRETMVLHCPVWRLNVALRLHRDNCGCLNYSVSFVDIGLITRRKSVRMPVQYVELQQTLTTIIFCAHVTSDK